MSYGKRSAWQRPHDAAYSSRAPSVERERPLPCSALRPEPQDCAEVAPADHDGRWADGAEGSEEHGADASRGSRRGGVPPEDAVASGRRAGLPEGYHSQSQPERPAPLPPAAWDLQAAEGRGQRQAQPVQELPDRLCPHRQLRTATHRRQAGHVPGDRPGLEIHLRRVPRQRRKEGGSSFSEKCRGRLPLQNPHRANR